MISLTDNFKKHILLQLSKNASQLNSNFFANHLQSPVFIIGCARSGTTMLENIIGTHKDIAVFPGEANNLWHRKYYPWLQAESGVPPLWSDPRTFTQISLRSWTTQDTKRIKSIFGAFQFFSLKPDFVNKSAMVAFMIPHILRLFPNSRLIHIYRDGRSVSLSYAKREYIKMQKHADSYKRKGYFFSFDDLLENMAFTWREHIHEIEIQKQKLDKSRFIELSYEDFCNDPKMHLNIVSDFLYIDSKCFVKYQYDRIKNMNYKYKEDLDKLKICKLNNIMETALELKGYQC